eukprot:5007455-Prymnesium_polylepis.1
MAISRNYFNNTLCGDRRMKNAVIAIEWVPNCSEIGGAAWIAEPNDLQSSRLQKSLDLLRGQAGSFGVAELRAAVRAADGELRASDSELQDRLLDSGALAEMDGEAQPLTAAAFQELLAMTGRRQQEAGRYFALVSLAEAATI